MKTSTNLQQWAEAHSTNDGLSAGLAFPLAKGQVVKATHPMRLNRYVRRGEWLKFDSLSFMSALFRNAGGQWVRVPNAKVANLAAL